MHPLALAASAVVLAATLVAAAIHSPKVPAVLVALPGALALTALGVLAVPHAESAVRRIAPTVAFLVVILVLARLADREGLFTWAAAVTARLSGRSAAGLLARVVVLSAVVTAVLSLDATVVLLTPVVLATAGRMGIPPRPHAYAAGHLANSASLLLPVSNLTNLLVFGATGLSFLHFAGLMVAPQAAAVVVEYAVLRTLFRRDVAQPVGEPVLVIPKAPVAALVVVSATVAGFAVASLLGVSPIWPAVAGVAVLAVRQLLARRTRLIELVRAADLPFALFVIGLAVVVEAVLANGVGGWLEHVLPRGTALLPLLAVAAIGAVVANLLNNLPAVLALLPAAAVGGPAVVLALLIGVNIGPNLTYVGSLANLLWRRVIGADAPGALRFSAVGAITVPLTLLAATTALWAGLRA